MSDPTSPRVIAEYFKHRGLKPRRQLGQNFLVDANIARKITEALDVAPGDAVLEIGPGAGALSINLARSGARLVAVEIDRGLAGLLEELLQPWPDAAVLRDDVLKLNWQNLIDSHFSGEEPVKLISNLPYNISGPFMYSIFRVSFPFQAAVLMLQKEVARRLVAAPGDADYSSLSVICRYYTQGKVLFDVSKNVFWPRPTVGSAVVKLLPRERILADGEEPLFWQLVQGVFRYRRKTIANSLSRFLGWSRQSVSDLLSAAFIDPAERPEQLDLERFALLTRITYNKRVK